MAEWSPREAKSLWGALLKHPAWEELCKMSDEHVSQVAGLVLSPARTTEDTLMQNVQRGEIMGVHYVLGLPATLLEEAERELDKQTEDDDNEPQVDDTNVPSPEGDGEGGPGFSDANAENLADLYGSDEVSEVVVADPDPVVPETPPVTEPPVVPVAPVVPPVVTPVAPQPVAPVVQPSAPTTPVPIVTPPVAPVVAAPVQPVFETPQVVAPVETPEQQTERLSTERVRLTGELERMYAIPEAEVDAYRETPEAYLPKLAAKLHVEVLTAVANGIYAQLPNLMQGILQARQQQTTHEEQFFSRWDRLNTPELKPKVLEMVKTYRQFNPQAPFETLVDEVGAMAHVRFRVPFDEKVGTPAPAAPVAGATPKAAPFVPAGAGGASAPVSSAGDGNQFTQLANEILRDGW